MQLHPHCAVNPCLCPGFCMEDWSVLVCQSSSISQSESLDVSVCPVGLGRTRLSLSWLGLTNKRRDECLQLDGGWTVSETFRCRGLGLVFRGTAETSSPPWKHAGLEQKENYGLDLQISWSFWTGLLKTHNALVDLYNCCLLPFPCFSFHAVKKRVFGLDVALRRDAHTEAGQQRETGGHVLYDL